MKDEDYAYEQARQRRIDNVTDLRRPQRFRHTDPWPEVAFREDVPPALTMQKWEKIGWAIAIGFWATFVFLNPFGWNM